MAPEQNDPAKFMTELGAGMVAMHEVYASAVDAGFTEKQAMDIVLQMIAGISGNNSSGR